MARRFDPSRPSGRVEPPYRGAHTYQDGIYYGGDNFQPLFDKDGNDLQREVPSVMGSTPSEATDQRTEQPVEQVQAPAASDNPELRPFGQSAPAAEPQAGTPQRKDQDDSAKDPRYEANDDVDLKAWADGRVKYHWFKVRDAISETLGVNVSNAERARAVIKERLG